MPASEYSMDADRTADVLTRDRTPFRAFVGDRPELLRGLTDCGYATASPIQVAALPVVIAGHDTIVEAKNGTGKTLTFVVPVLMRLKAEQSYLQSVVLAPTREIAVQIQQCFKKVGQHLPKLKCEYFIGGTPVDEDKQKAKGCQIAVGSPGRIKHLLNEHVLKGSEVKIFILDEVDRLFSDKNFTKDIRLIDAKFPKIKQMVAVSASIDKKDMSLFDEFMQEYSMVKGSEEDMNASEDPSKFLLGIKQYVACVKAVSTNIILLPAKNVRLLNILKNLPYTQCIVFTNYMTRVEAVCNMLRDHNYKADYIRGDQDQNIRLKLVDRLTSFKSKILVATDLIARGIDSSNVDLVINMDCPHDWSTYLHRIGRAGRFGNKGNAFTILDDDKELKMFKRIINSIENVKVKMLPIAIEKPILEYTDSELEDLNLTLAPNGIEENEKESTQDDSKLESKELKSNINCPVVDKKQEEIVNKSMCAPDKSEEEQLQKLCEIVKETEKKLIDNNMVNKKYLNSDRSFVLFDPVPLLSDTDVNYSPQELIEIMSKYSEDIESNETEQKTVSEKHEHEQNFNQLHQERSKLSFADNFTDKFDYNSYDMDTMLNAVKETQNHSVSQNNSGVVNYTPGTRPTEEFENKVLNVNETATDTQITNVSENPEHTNNSCETETNAKVDKPRFTNVYDLFQIPDFSLVKNPEVCSDNQQSTNGQSVSKETNDKSSFSYYQQKEDSENLIENCEGESENEEESENEGESENEEESKNEDESEIEEESVIEVSDFETEPVEIIENDAKCVTIDYNAFTTNGMTDEGEKKKDDVDTLNITYEKDDQRANGLGKSVEKPAQTRPSLGFQGPSSVPPRREVHQAEINHQLVDHDILNDWYRQWKQQLSIIQTYTRKME